MGETTQRIPKPMIPVGNQPILWHIMKWYSSWGHKEFILCLGYRAEVVKRWFLEYKETHANDFVLARGDVILLRSDMADWHITFLDSGVHSTIGDRLRVAKPYIGEDEMFLCTYGDGLTDAPLDHMIETLVESGRTGLFMSVRPRLSYHVVDADEHGAVREICDMRSADVRINGGFFVFKTRIFDDLLPEEDLMDMAARLSHRGDMMVYRYDGFWAPMDTMKDKQDLDTMIEAGNGRAPWLRLGDDRVDSSQS